MFDKELSAYSFAATAKLPIHAAGATFNGIAPYRIPVLTRFAGVCNSKFEYTAAYLKTLNADYIWSCLQMGSVFIGRFSLWYLIISSYIIVL